MYSNILSMVEFNKNIKFCELRGRQELDYEISLFGWKPEGDLLSGYLFGLIYIGVDAAYKKFGNHD
jgi:hypothetical protein